MFNVGCSKTVIIKEFEKTRPRIYKGDKRRLLDICVELDKIAEKRDGFLKQGVNRSTMSDAILVALRCLEKYGLQLTTHKQASISEVV